MLIRNRKAMVDVVPHFNGGFWDKCQSSKHVAQHTSLHHVPLNWQLGGFRNKKQPLQSLPFLIQLIMLGLATRQTLLGLHFSHFVSSMFFHWRLTAFFAWTMLFKKMCRTFLLWSWLPILDVSNMINTIPSSIKHITQKQMFKLDRKRYELQEQLSVLRLFRG